MTAAQGAGSRLAVLALAAAAAGLWCVPATRDLAPLDAEAARRTAEVTRQFGMERPVVWIVEPRGGSGWTSEALGRVQALTRGVFALPGVLAPDVVSIASPNLRDVQVSDAGFSPRYLMGEVPRAPAAVAALRARVEQDPLLRGSLVAFYPILLKLCFYSGLLLFLIDFHQYFLRLFALSVQRQQ